MAKSYDDETNGRLRAVARRVMNDHYGGKQVRLAKALGVTPTFVSEFLSGTRGAGLQMLIGLARFAPMETLEILRIDYAVVRALLAGAQDERGMGIDLLPDVVRRGARACIELTGCLPADACAAAIEVFGDYGDLPNTNADWWCAQIRENLPKGSKSGERASVRLLLPAKPAE